MNEENIEQILNKLGREDVPPEVHKIAEEASEDFTKTLEPSRQHILWTPILHSRMARLAAAAVIIIIIFGGVNFWPDSGSQNGKWWLGPPAAWGQEIIDALEKVEALVYRQRVAYVKEPGPIQMNRSWERRYNAKDRYRRDRYDDGINITNTLWVVPDGEGLLTVEVSLEYECYFEQRDEPYGFIPDPWEKMCSYVRLLDKPHRVLGLKTIEGRRCVGFEIGAGIYRSNRPGLLYRIWLDKETKLPARIERHLPDSFDARQTVTIIHDQFEYYREVPVDIFEPQIPEGFINAHPDDVSAAGQKEGKKRMTFVDVPAGLQNKIVATLKNVETGFYREYDEGPWAKNGSLIASSNSRRVFISGHNWRIEFYYFDQLQKIEWFVIEKDDSGKTDLEPNYKNLELTKTTVNFENKTYEVVTYDPQLRPGHPMDRILLLAGLVDRADRFLENQEIEGMECFWFEISAKKYGTNPDHMIHHLWFNKETNLPVRMEFKWLQDDGPRKTVKHQFEWNLALPAGTFTPYIPEGFTLIEPNEK
jgi:outer membrane lipoprotein-sorting protein